MAKQPDVLIIARHGARLDQANKEWHNTADQPWDSPLSYGGWIQSQNLGARIAMELNNLDPIQSSDGQFKETSAANHRPRKRRKITIHSSPYLRCVQTSIGIAAGMKHPQETRRERPAPTPFQRSSLSKPPMLVDDNTSPTLGESATALPSSARQDNGLTDLKIDAWLGEWLSAGYFDKSTAPPPSDELIKRAKEILKKPPEEIKGADVANTAIHEFDEVDWADKVKDVKDPKAMPTHEKTGLRAMAAKGYSMPKRSRTVSFTPLKEPNNPVSAPDMIGRRPRSSTYSPPVPTYSIAPQDSIPIGFVAHARDLCVDTDFEWDSQKSPLEWGDGGKYEEEWSTMHRRFRNGLQGLMSYYEMDLCYLDSDEAESDEETVVILVTHQAGCNALIRLVTGAPALHDVGTASLTLAVRKAGLKRITSQSSDASPTRRRGSIELGINYDYDMKIIASTEHLRAGSNPLGLNSPRLGVSPAFASRRMVGADSPEGFSIGDSVTWRSSSQTTIGRTSSMRGPTTSGSFSNESLNGSGLWSPRDTRSSSISSETSIDPRSPSQAFHKSSNSNVSVDVILEDAAIEDWAASGAKPSQSHTHIVASPIDDQLIWQPDSSSSAPPREMLVRSDSTKILGNTTAGTGLWGGVLVNPGGAKEGTPYSRSSFGTTDAPTPMWGPRSGNQRTSWHMSKGSFTATQEEDES